MLVVGRVGTVPLPVWLNSGYQGEGVAEEGRLRRKCQHHRPPGSTLLLRATWGGLGEGAPGTETNSDRIEACRVPGTRGAWPVGRRDVGNGRYKPGASGQRGVEVRCTWSGKEGC